MKNTVQSCSPLLLSIALLACGAAGDGGEMGADERTSPDGTRDDDFDTQELTEFRQAIPSVERLRAPVPGGEPDPNALALGGNSELANLAIASAVGVNVPAVLVVTVLRTLTLLPPSHHDAAKQEYVWGPWDNDDGYGKLLVYIKKNGADADFRYTYAMSRLVGDDVDTALPIIWGGATPRKEADEDGDVSGAGVTVWDFEADHAFEATHDPDYAADAPRDRGRFVMVFGRGENEDGKFKFNVAAFRDFRSKDAKPEEQLADLDYFYGHFDGNDGNTLDFADWMLDANFCGEDPTRCFDQATAEDLESGAVETLALRAAFLNRGVGRAEAVVTGGDIDNALSVVDCWDENIDTSYFNVKVNDEMLVEEGSCRAPFEAPLAELGVPTLADLDAEMLAKLDCVATTGTPCEE